jgi:ABC-type glycerol-3-phosphate transport system permease component
MRLGADKSFREFSSFFWNLFSLFLSLFYLLEGSKIFFMSSKHFIWIVRVSFYLWEFSWNFENFLGTFRALKTFSSLYWNCFRIEK